MVTVRPAEATDAASWLEMRCALWPESPEAEHRDEVDRYFSGRFLREPWAVLVAEGRDGRLLGFTELSIRPYAEGCRSHRVAYLEGWFVRPGARGQSVGKALVSASEDWGRSQGCAEFASDTDPENEISSSAHSALGFTDLGLVRCFMKRL
jgi:aminoglycoside 6'-N-acetyltransferase I